MMQKKHNPNSFLMRASFLQQGPENDGTLISFFSEVTQLLIDAGVRDVDVIQASLLHDTVEDSDATIDELEKIFGTRVARIVAEV